MAERDSDQAASPPRMAMVAYCAEHGLHGERGECFECGEPVEQIPYVSHEFHQRCIAEFKSNRAYVVMETTIRQLEGENETLRDALADVIEGETAEEGTPQWYALRNARGLLAASSDEQSHGGAE